MSFQPITTNVSKNKFLTKIEKALESSFLSVIDRAIEDALLELEKTKKINVEDTDTELLTDLVVDHLQKNYNSFEDVKKEMISDRISRIMFKRLRAKIPI